MKYKTKITGKQSGFTLIELMVGMTIGLVVVLAMGQILSVNEGYKRTTMYGNDSMVNGSLALNTIERDGKNAGYGITTVSNSLGCEVRMKYGSDTTVTFTLSGLMITNGANGAPDTIRFTSSNKNGVALPTKVVVDHPVSATNFFVDSDTGIVEGDLMIAVPETCDSDNWASVFQVTGTGGNNNNNGSGQGQNQVLHNSGQSEWNQPGGQTIFPSAGYPIGSYLINMGNMGDRSYSIVNNNLQLAEFNSSTGDTETQILFPQIIQLQAQYGKDTNNDDTVDTWDNTTPTNNAGWSQIRAVRVAIVARSVQWQKDVVTTNDADCPSPSSICWAGGKIAGSNLNSGNSNNTDWQHYRYHVFETLIPLRNIIWQQ